MVYLSTDDEVSTSNSCPRIADCKLFPKFKASSTLGFWKAMYCDGQYERCSRFQLASEGKSVPSTMLPNGKDLSEFSVQKQ